MTTSESHNSEIPASLGRDETRTAQEALIERKRQLVKDIFAGKPDVEYIPADQVPDTSRINKKGEVIGSAKRQQIADARQALINAIKTIPIPPSLPFDDISLN